MVKYRSRWLATRARLQLLNESPTNVCPLCGCEEETVEHILLCSQQADNRRKLYRRLEQWLRHFAVPLKLQLLLVSHLKHFLGDSPPPDLNVALSSTGLQRFVREQTSIGWGNLLSGFTSTSLATYMDTYLPEEANCDGPEWVIRLLRLLQLWVANCWHARCKHEHRKEKEHASATRLNLLSRIEHAYSLQHKVPHSFRHCFKFSTGSFQDKSDNFLENWLTLYEKLILGAAQDPQRQQNITEFFTFLKSD